MSTPRLGIVLEGIAGAATVAATVVLGPLLRPWYSRWGARDEEVRRSYPGDEYVPRPKSQLTCAISVQAPPERIWPWLVQIGCRRAGWYSYDLLDNGGVPSADRIVPELQRLAVGDVVPAMPKGNFGFPVAAIDPCRTLTLGGTLDTASGASVDAAGPLPKSYFSGDQTFHLENDGQGRARLIFRMRTDWNASFANNLIYRAMLEPMSFVMGRKMLRNLKQRVERHAP